MSQNKSSTSKYTQQATHILQYPLCLLALTAISLVMCSVSVLAVLSLSASVSPFSLMSAVHTLICPFLYV